MKVILLEGSPNKNAPPPAGGLLAGRAPRKPGTAWRSWTRPHANIHPCTGCIRCGYEGPCMQKDDVEAIRRKILGADMLVFCHALVLLRDDAPS